MDHLTARVVKLRRLLRDRGYHAYIKGNGSYAMSPAQSPMAVAATEVLRLKITDPVVEMLAFFEQSGKNVNFVPAPDGHDPLEQTVIHARRSSGLH
ncbi:hypothetical protein [Tropicimonas sp. S265A]|uniref:hypothetical protein n=1 Tax=Tropicimonas sp. S265A TaxID=3415134 RepID=UPI003C7C44FF